MRTALLLLLFIGAALAHVREGTTSQLRDNPTQFYKNWKRLHLRSTKKGVQSVSDYFIKFADRSTLSNDSSNRDTSDEPSQADATVDPPKPQYLRKHTKTEDGGVPLGDSSDAIQTTLTDGERFNYLLKQTFIDGEVVLVDGEYIVMDHYISKVAQNSAWSHINLALDPKDGETELKKLEHYLVHKLIENKTIDEEFELFGLDNLEEKYLPYYLATARVLHKRLRLFQHHYAKFHTHPSTYQSYYRKYRTIVIRNQTTDGELIFRDGEVIARDGELLVNLNHTELLENTTFTHTQTQTIIEDFVKFEGLGTKKPLFITVEMLNVDHPMHYDDPLKVSEAYEIYMNSDGNVTLKCAGYVSFLRALESFAELISDYGTISRLPLYVADFPSYPWRGIMLDLARHFMPLDVIMRTIRGMQLSKLNVLHLHVTDSESFPFQLKKFPKVTEYGAYSEKEVYTRNDFAKLIVYAQHHGVVIVPEFDQPTHTAAWARSPEFEEINACGSAPPLDWTKYCYQPPCGQLDPTNNKTYELVQAILEEAQSLFTSKYFHFGADEFIPACWNYSETIREYMQENNVEGLRDLFDHYFLQVNKHIQSDRMRIYWNSDNLHNLTYHKDGILQYWQDGESEAYDPIRELDNPIIISPYTDYYLDCGTGNLLGANSWCDPYKAWWSIYSYNLTKIDIGDRLLGGEATLWSEMIDQYNLDQKAWPRATVLGLKLWNSQDEPTRLYVAKYLIRAYRKLKFEGIHASPVTVQYCEIYPENCFFD